MSANVMRLPRVCLIFVVSAACIVQARATEFAQCPPPPNTVRLTRLAQAPDVLRAALKRDVGMLADAGQPFMATDVVPYRYRNQALPVDQAHVHVAAR